MRYRLAGEERGAGENSIARDESCFTYGVTTGDRHLDGIVEGHFQLGGRGHASAGDGDEGVLADGGYG